MTTADLFSEVFDFPDPESEKRYAALIGIDGVKERLINEVMLLVDPTSVEAWSKRHHGKKIQAAEELTTRPPLLILAGDVGTGKTELSETFMSEVTRRMRVDGTLYVLSLAARGQGAVGQMSSLIGSAFAEVAAASKPGNGGQPRHINILLIDEGDALAQSRESSQMHHEDRAGVNALIKGIDRFRQQNLPALVILCTNRLNAIDPAVRRRAAFTVELERPNPDQRRHLLQGLLADANLSEQDLENIVNLTGPTQDRHYGYTYSDIRQRLLPEAVMTSLANDQPLDMTAIVRAIENVPPTRPFSEGENQNG